MKGVFSKSNISAARQYYAEARAQHPELRGTNPKSDAQVIRYANKVRHLEQRGVAPTPALLRGHATTPEHPGRPVKALAPEQAQYVQQQRSARPAQMPRGATVYKTGSVMTPKLHTKAEVRAYLRATPGMTVLLLSYEDKTGQWHKKYIRMKTEAFLKRVNSNQSWRNIVADLAGDDYPEPVTGLAGLFITR